MSVVLVNAFEVPDGHEEKVPRRLAGRRRLDAPAARVRIQQATDPE
jgi:hypothetical protein